MDSKKIALNALCTGVVAGVATTILFGKFDVEYFGMPINSAIAVGSACAVGSVISDVASDMVIKKLGVSNQVMNGSVLATQLGLGAIASGAVLSFGGVPTSNLLLMAGIGGGSKLAGDYVYSKVLDPRTGFLPF